MFMMILTSSMLIVFLLLLVQMFLSSQASINDSQLTAIESGFEALKQSLFISSSFFLLAILFVLFDMELILLVPCVSMYFTKNVSMLLCYFIILMFVLITLSLEWTIHGLKWTS